MAEITRAQAAAAGNATTDFNDAMRRFYISQTPMTYPALLSADATPGPSDSLDVLGTNYWTVQVAPGATAFSLVLEVSVDGSSWQAVGAPITAAGVYARGDGTLFPKWARLNVTDGPDTGALTASLTQVRN
jgi:hypothetical protein